MNSIFYLILIILVSSFVIERILDALNLRSLKPELPLLVAERYDKEKYAQSQLYKKETSKFGLLVSGFHFVLIMVFIISGGFGWLNDLVAGISKSEIIQALLFFGIFGFFFDILGIPFDLYSTFVIEEKFGFNKTTPRTFVLDKLKGWLITAIIGGGILALLVWIYEKTGSWFWLIAWGAVTLFTVFMSLFYSDLIVPLFNKQKPLGEGDLRAAIKDFAMKTGFSIKEIFEIDGSKRSTKANAYFTGLGRKKRIVLYDTLINDLAINEIVAVLAHEIGHNKKKHVTIGLILGIIQTGILLFLLSFFLENQNFAEALGANQAAFHLSVLVFGILFTPLSMIIGLFMNQLSRRNEYQADAFASNKGMAEGLASGLIKLSEKNLSNLTPHPAYVFVHYSHPTLLQRLEKLKSK